MLPVLFADQDLGSLSPAHSFTVTLLSFSEPASFDRVLKLLAKKYMYHVMVWSLGNRGVC